MTAPATLHAATIALLEAIPNITVFDGAVEDNPPAVADGRVLPYAVLWPAVGYRPAESRSLETVATVDLRWSARVTVAAGSVAWLLQAVAVVRAALDGQVLGAFSGPLEEDAVEQIVLEDRDVRPFRFYVPLSFSCTTGG